MTNETYIAEYRAIALLRNADYTEVQARAILAHSKKQTFSGETYYPLNYITKRAQEERN